MGPLPGRRKIFSRGFEKNTGLGLDITGITIRETGELDKGARFEMTVLKGIWQMTGKGNEWQRKKKHEEKNTDPPVSTRMIRADEGKNR
jgi:hypothetical protein